MTASGSSGEFEIVDAWQEPPGLFRVPLPALDPTPLPLLTAGFETEDTDQDLGAALSILRSAVKSAPAKIVRGRPLAEPPPVPLRSRELDIVDPSGLLSAYLDERPTQRLTRRGPAPRIQSRSTLEVPALMLMGALLLAVGFVGGWLLAQG